MGELEDRADPEGQGEPGQQRGPRRAAAGRAGERRARHRPWTAGRGRRSVERSHRFLDVGWTSGGPGAPAAAVDVFPRPSRRVNLEAGFRRCKPIHRKRIERSRPTHARATARCSFQDRPPGELRLESPCSGPTTRQGPPGDRRGCARRRSRVALVAAFAVVNLPGGGDDGGDRPARPRARRRRRRRRPWSARRASGPSAASAWRRAGGRDGAPARRSARCPAARGCRAGRCRRARRCGSCSTSSDAGAARGGAALSAPRCRSDGAPPAPVALDRRAAFLLNTRTGDLVLPSGAAAAGHAHGGAPATPGRASRRSAPAAASPGRRSSRRGAGRAVAHDGDALPRRALSRARAGSSSWTCSGAPRAGAVTVGGRVGAVAFAGAARGLWAVDEEAGELVGVDPRTRGDRQPGRRRPRAARARRRRAARPGAGRRPAAGRTLVDLAAGRSLDARGAARRRGGRRRGAGARDLRRRARRRPRLSLLPGAARAGSARRGRSAPARPAPGPARSGSPRTAARRWC